MEELEKHHEAQLKDRDRFKELEKKNSEFDSHMYTYFQKIKTNFGSFF